VQSAPEPEPEPEPTTYCPAGYTDVGGKRINWGLGAITIVHNHQQCADRCTQFSGVQFNGGCKGFQTGMYFGKLFCRSYGGNYKTTGCAAWALPGSAGMASGAIGDVLPDTGQMNVGGNCCTRSGL